MKLNEYLINMMDYDFEEDNEKLSSSFNLEIVYNDDEKIMYIGTSDSSGEKYKCEKYSDIVKNVKSYCDNYLILDDETESDVNLEHEL